MSTAQTETSQQKKFELWLTPAFGVFALIGVLAFIVGLGSEHHGLRAWQAFHINFLYWTGLAFAGVMISAIFEMTSSKWGQNVKRIAESSVSLIPLALIAYIIVAIGNKTLFEHAHHGHELIGGKEAWLDPSFMLPRDFISLALLALVAVFFVYHEIRPGLGAAILNGDVEKPSLLAKWMTKGYRSYEFERKRSIRMRQVLAPILTIFYALVFTLLAFDQIMALDPMWISTLFGAYFFITNLFLGWATLSFLSVLIRRRSGTDSLAEAGKRIRTDDLHDLGKLLFAFCMLSADFFWSQYVVIWYGNIPEETPFVIKRTTEAPWANVAFAVLIFCYALPFVLLLFKKIKRTEVTLLSISLLIMLMVWIERFMLVSPSLWHDVHSLPLGFVDLGVTLGFIGLAGFSYRWVLRTFIHAPPEILLDTLAQNGEEKE